MNMIGTSQDRGGTCRVRAFTLVELLVVMSIIIVLMGLTLSGIFASIGNARKVVAKNAEVGVNVGINAYYTDYGRYPDLGTTGADTFVAADNYRIMDVLRGRNVTENPRKIPFFTYKPASGISKLKDGFDPAGNLLDPWGYQYKLKYDTSYDGDVSAYGETVPTGALIWSVGKNGVEVVNYTMIKGSDDVTSWR